VVLGGDSDLNLEAAENTILRGMRVLKTSDQ
jgi:acid phosphatase class B